MKVILGIDAAWTDKNPSGVALAINSGGGWELKGAFPSFGHFLAAAQDLPAPSDAAGAWPSASELLDATDRLTGSLPDLVAVDMPMALQPIVGRRMADTAISVAYGAKWCAAHSPNKNRPGPISDRFRSDFAAHAYELCIDELTCPGIIEVYPHPALVELCGEPRRLPYKVGKVRSYWPKLTPRQRQSALLAEWSSIETVLEPYLSGATLDLNTSSEFRMSDLKAREDMLDAIVCCICGIRAMDGAAKSFHGDSNSAIWVPMADPKIQARTLLPSSPYSARAEMRMELFADRLAAGEYPNLTLHGSRDVRN